MLLQEEGAGFSFGEVIVIEQMREHWSHHFGFIMAAIGSAIGLGILWKFPYIVGGNGGGLFLMTYLACVAIIGVPILIAELILGRHAQCAAIRAFAHFMPSHSFWKITGWFGVLASFLIMSFYSVIAGWGMNYVLMSLNGFYQNLDQNQIATLFDLLRHSGSLSLFWHLIFTMITVAIVLPGVRRGIEYWAKIMTKTLLVLLVLLFLYAVTLPGFVPALRFIFLPNIERFTPSSIVEALSLAFWTLSIGQGIMISYGSYMTPTKSIAHLAGIVSLSVILVAVLSALMIFPVIFTFNLSPSSGPGLIFQTIPYLFAHLPGSLILSTLFFILFVFTALTSAIPLVEVVATNLMELLGWTRKRSVWVVGCGTALFGCPSALAKTPFLFPHWKTIYGTDFLTTINQFVSIWLIPIGGILTAIFVGWVIDPRILRREFSLGHSLTWIWRPWHFLIKWTVPCMIFIIMVQTSGIFDFDSLLKFFKKG